jgi:VWFA-related protein
MARPLKPGGSRFLFLFLAMLSVMSVGLHYQPGIQASASEAARQTSAASSDQDKIRVNANEVLAPVTVTDKAGEFVLDLTQKDFHVFDNGVEQKIAHWDLDGDPLAVGLVIETSTHVRAMIPAIRHLGSIFTETVMALDGEAAVITYDDEINVVQPFTHDHDAVEKCIADAKFTVPEIRLYDGMARAIALLKSQPSTYRRIMLVVGESQDTSSVTNLGQILRDAVAANIAVYGVGLSSTTADLRYGTVGQRDGKKLTSRLSKNLPSVSTVGPGADPVGRPYYDVMTPAIWLLTRATNKVSDHQLEVAAAATGGIHYSALRDSTIRTLMDNIGGELHAQYILTYVPTDAAAGFHNIKVTVDRPNLTVRSRPGYFPIAR